MNLDYRKSDSVASISFGTPHCWLKPISGNPRLSEPGAYMSSVGERVKWARKRLKMSQQRLCAAIGIQQSTLSELENNKSTSSTHLAVMARVLGVNGLWLANGIGEPLAPDGPSLDAALADSDRTMMREMGTRITRLRERKGLTPDQLGRPVADAVTVRAIEAGTVWPGPTVLDQIALRLSTSTDWLIRGDAVDTFHPAMEDSDLVRRIHDPARTPHERVFS